MHGLRFDQWRVFQLQTAYPQNTCANAPIGSLRRRGPFTFLGHRLIMARPRGGSELEHDQEVGGVLLVARGEPSEVFDPAKEPFEAVARAVEHRADATLPAAMNDGGDVGRSTGGFDAAA